MMRLLRMTLLSSLALALTGPVRAADEDPPKGYKADIHHKEVKFDRSKKEDLAKLQEHLEKGEVESLTADRPINPLDIRWDLGLWTLVVFVLLLFILSKVAWGP